MAPFGNTSAPTDFCDFFAELPPLDTGRKSPCSSSFFLEPQELEDKRVYCLAVVDDYGEVVRPATEQDLLALLDESPKEEPLPKAPEPQAAQASVPDAYFKELLSKGPVCKHCGVTESPQWRRGPINKAILCNACGTRYRRTGQLNHATQNSNRKRATPSDCAREMVSEKSRGGAMKQPRIVA